MHQAHLLTIPCAVFPSSVCFLILSFVLVIAFLFFLAEDPGEVLLGLLGIIKDFVYEDKLSNNTAGLSILSKAKTDLE